MRILFASSEAVPFAKTGGLGNVAGTLPRALAQNGHNVFLILSNYRQVDRKQLYLTKGQRSISVEGSQIGCSYVLSSFPKGAGHGENPLCR